MSIPGPSITGTCPKKDDPFRQNKTWVWSKNRCSGNDPNISDCPAGFKDSIGKSETSYIVGNGSSYWCLSAGFMNKAKCYRGASSFTTNELVKCCTGEKNAYSCPPAFCSQNTTNCVNILTEYCRKGTNITTEACTKTLKNADEKIYNEILKKYCNGDNLNNTVCIEYCKANVNECRDKLRNFCKDKVGNSNYDNICSCFYENTVYNNMSNKLAKEWNFPSELNDPKPQCIYDKCKQADIVPSGSCKAISIASCIQNVNLDTKGDSKIDNVYINQDSECKSKFNKLSENEPGGSSQSGPGGQNKPPNNEPPPPPEEETGLSGLTIGLIVGGSVLFLALVIIIGVIIYKRRNDSE